MAELIFLWLQTSYYLAGDLVPALPFAPTHFYNISFWALNVDTLFKLFGLLAIRSACSDLESSINYY